MLGVVFAGNSRAEVREFPRPEPRPGEALVQVFVSALCGTELPQYRSEEGSRGAIPGHEMAGRVVEVNQTRTLRVGDRVSLYIMIGCGRCHYCQRGDWKHCLDIAYLSGGHAEFVAAPEACCVRLPDDLDYEHGVLVVGDLVGTSYHAVRRIGVTALDTAVVLGCGPVGLGILNVLRFLGVPAIASEVVPYRRALAEQVGASRTVDPSAEDLREAVRAMTDGLGADVAIDCTGRQESLRDALECVRCQGRVAVVGQKGECVINAGQDVMYREIEVIGSLYYDLADLPGILALYRRGLKVDHIVTHHFPIERADEAFATFAAGESGKVLIHYPGHTERA
jgi:2-desacetyl-2-hydroxyethyl bacteriochlorophyllide A dehydrogenase